MVFRSKQYCFLAAIFLRVCLIGSPRAAISTPKPVALSFGTSSLGSIFTTLSVVFSNVITKTSGIAVTVESVGGFDATIRGMAVKKLDRGMVNANSATDAYLGVGAFGKSAAG